MDFSDHSAWRLLLTVCMDQLRATMFNSETRRAVPYMVKRWSPQPSQVLKSLEDAVYDDPLIVDDYRTAVLVRPSRLLVVPAARCGDEDDAARMLAEVEPARDPDVWMEPVTDSVTALYTTPEGVRGFLDRTFATQDMHLALLPLLHHFGPKAAAEGGDRMWVDLHDGALDVVAYRDGGLLLANTWAFETAPDAAYYIVYAWQALGLDTENGELHVSGAEATRRELMPMLRRYVKFATMTVLPSAVSAMLKQGLSLAEALTLNNWK